mgnify:CR=1 FL=1|tara:strand:- start:1281 stop:2681 length:1401 start_codon:yes stop_codon:yes gene_type:complete
MATAQVTYTATGGESTYAFSFTYLNSDHVKLYLDGVEDTSATFPTASSITASAGNPAVNTVVLVIRETPRTALLTTISNSGSIRNTDLNNQSLQALYVAEEARDKLDGVMSLSADGTYWDAQVSAVNKLISNVLDPVSDQDASTKAYTDLIAATAVSDAQTAASTATTQAGIATTQASSATSSASAASTSETNAASSETAAGLSETAAALSETNAAADAVLTAADVVTTNADVVLTNADVVTAGNSASTATTQASNASTSASNASTSETNAAASESAAQAAQTAAETAADNFDDTYLGAKASAPTVDNDGDALSTGDLYFNTGTNDLWVYNGSVWQLAAVSTAGFPTLAGTNAWTGTNDFQGTLTIDGVQTTSDDDGTKTTGTYTPVVTDGNFKEIVNGGAFTLAPPAETCTMVIQVLNNASAGAITTSGFTIVDGDAQATTNTNKFMYFICRTADYSYLTIKALQ